MKPNAQTCPIERLEALLSGALSTFDEAQVSHHLEQCQSCRRQLESLAAAEESWQHASNYLRDDPHDLLSISQLDIEHPAIPAQIAQVLDALAPTDDSAMLGRLGGYEISGAIGAGGMGVVLKGIDRALDRTVAIKVMAPHLATSGAARQRFSREARAAAAVIHPNVIAIHSVCTDAVLPFLVMPYIGGASLQKRIDSEGALPVADTASSNAVDIGSQAELVPSTDEPATTSSVDNANAIPLPWEADEPDLRSWDDQLGPILEHIHERILDDSAQ